jgi:hypothetical protein
MGQWSMGQWPAGGCPRPRPSRVPPGAAGTLGDAGEAPRGGVPLELTLVRPHQLTGHFWVVEDHGDSVRL